MNFTLECPKCKQTFQVCHEDLAKKDFSLQCCHCGNVPTPDIMSAYQNVGKTLSDLYGCCKCSDLEGWLPQDEKK